MGAAVYECDLNVSEMNNCQNKRSTFSLLTFNMQIDTQFNNDEIMKSVQVDLNSSSPGHIHVLA